MLVLLPFGDSNSIADLLLLLFMPFINGEARFELGLINLI
jgi:hypothetical protein